MKAINVLRRLVSPVPKPQSLAWDGATLWMGSKLTKRIYAIDPVAWTVTWETAAPGIPWGMTVVAGGELRVICGETAEDNRIIRRCVAGQGFDAGFGIPCPDDTGSQLGWDGKNLHVSQWYPKKVHTIDGQGNVLRTVNAVHGICGQVIVDGAIYLMSTDAEETTEYWLTKVEVRGAGERGEAGGAGEASGVSVKITDVATVPLQARALAWDGKYFWTNHREQNEIVMFEV